MKKSIIFLSLALVALSNVTMASTGTASLPAPVKNEYSKATPLAVAIAKGDITSVKAFIGYGVNINETSNDMTPLMLAARYNQVEIIDLLLQNGASIKVTNSRGFNALKYARLSNATQAADVLTKAAKA